MKLPFRIGNRPIQGNFDALAEAPTYMRVSRAAAQAIGAGAWTIISWTAVVSEQAQEGHLSLDTSAPAHVLVETAGVYVAQLDVIFTLGTGDHLIYVARNNEATPIVAAGSTESTQMRVGPLANTSVVSVGATPFLCAAGDMIHGQAFATNAQNMTAHLRVTRVGR